MAYRLHSAQERRVAPRLRFLTSPLPFGGLAPLKETSGEDMERWWWKEKECWALENEHGTLSSTIIFFHACESLRVYSATWKVQKCNEMLICAAHVSHK